MTRIKSIAHDNEQNKYFSSDKSLKSIAKKDIYVPANQTL